MIPAPIVATVFAVMGYASLLDSPLLKGVPVRGRDVSPQLVQIFTADVLTLLRTLQSENDVCVVKSLNE